MKKVFIAIGLIGLFTACSTENTTEVAAENTPEKEIVAVVPNKLLTMEVDGMVCQMGCGGSIRKALLETGGVSQCEFDFEEDRQTNIAKISFNKDLVSADKLVDVVTTINDKQFTVGTVKTISLEDISTSTVHEDEMPEEENAESTINVSSSAGFEMPNLLDFISELLVF